MVACCSVPLVFPFFAWLALPTMLFGRMVHPPKSSANNATAAAAATAAGAMMAAASAASCWFGTRAATSSSVSCSSRALSSQSSSSSSSSYFARTCWLRTQQSGLVGGLQQFHPLSSWGRPTAHRLFGAPFPSSRTTAVSSGSRRFSSSSSSSSSNSSSSSSSSSSFMAWYEDKLLRAPVLTKMMTGLCLWSVGDAVAQLVPPMTGQGPPLEQYDYARTGRAAFFGFALHAPTSHVHYNFLEWMTVQGGFKGLQIPVFKTIMEQVRCFFWFGGLCVVRRATQCLGSGAFVGSFLLVGISSDGACLLLLVAILFHTFRRSFVPSFVRLFVCSFHNTHSLFIGRGSVIRCTMLPWERCKE